MRLKSGYHLFFVVFILIFLIFSSNFALSTDVLIDDLKNITYTVGTNFDNPRKVKLINGKYSKTDSPFEFIMTWIKEISVGDLNGDGIQDGAVILFSNYGGSGSFAELAAVINKEGMLEHVASVFLGDRVAIKSLTIEDGVILVDMLSHGPKDPMATPTQETTKKYKLIDQKLVEQ